MKPNVDLKVVETLTVITSVTKSVACWWRMEVSLPKQMSKYALLIKNAY